MSVLLLFSGQLEAARRAMSNNAQRGILRSITAINVEAFVYLHCNCCKLDHLLPCISSVGKWSGDWTKWASQQGIACLVYESVLRPCASFGLENSI